MDGKKLKIKGCVISLLAGILSLFWGGIRFAYAQEEAVYFAVYPVQATVSYGANNKLIDLKFKVVNNDVASQHDTKTLSGFTLRSSAGATIPVTVKADKSCPNMTLPPKSQRGSCLFHVQFRASGNQAGNYLDKTTETLSLALQYSANGKTDTIQSPAFPLIYATGSQVPSLSRNISAKNNCDFPIWVGIAPYPVKSLKPDPDVFPKDLYSCNSTRDCYPGSNCITVRKKKQNGSHDQGLKRCFWTPPTPAKNQYLIKPYSGATSISLPYFDNGIETLWEGAIAARTDCENGSCETAECGSTKKGKSGIACAPGKLFAVPSSHAKFTLSSSHAVIYNTTSNGNAAEDIYAVSIAQGINVPLSVEPQYAHWGGSHKPYHCGIAGGRSSSYPLGSCSWNFSPPKNDYVWVSHEPKSIACDTDSDCSKPMQCGLSYNPTANSGQQINKTCGIKLGFWSPLALCTKDPQFASSLFNCNTLAHDGSRAADLLACTKGALQQSCYKNNAQHSCCGCVNWESVPGVKVPSSPLTKSCQNENPNWTIHAHSKVVWLKSACPTASVYPYDEASSAFRCQSLDTHHMNTTHYTVTFCP